MAGWAHITDELANNVRDALDGLDWEIQVEPNPVLNPTTPTVDIFPSDPPTNSELQGFGDIEGHKIVTVRLRVAGADSDARWDVVYSMMDVEDEHSVAQAIEDDQTLNGYATQVVVTGGTGVSLFPRLDGLGGYMGVQWTVQIVEAHS